jgi:hypothetical protein
MLLKKTEIEGLMVSWPDMVECYRPVSVSMSIEVEVEDCLRTACHPISSSGIDIPSRARS